MILDAIYGINQANFVKLEINGENCGIYFNVPRLDVEFIRD
jgi:hypothetical protein